MDIAQDEGEDFFFIWARMDDMINNMMKDNGVSQKLVF